MLYIINSEIKNEQVASNSKKELIMLLVTFFVGAYGVHKFIEGKIGMGILYLFTGGLFGIGWIIDVVVAINGIVERLKSGQLTEEAERVRAQAVQESMVTQSALQAVQEMAEIKDLRGLYF